MSCEVCGLPASTTINHVPLHEGCREAYRLQHMEAEGWRLHLRMTSREVYLA